jgi:hypothetical protein
MSSKQELRNFIKVSAKPKKNITNVNGYTIDKKLSNRTNKVYVNPDTDDVVHTITGTHNIKDWDNNFTIPFGMYEHTDRYKRSETIQKKANKKYGKENVNLVTHSQTGQAANILQNKGLVGGTNTTLNPAIIGKHNKKVHVKKSLLDPVSYFTTLNKNDELIMPTSINPIYEHSSRILGDGVKTNIKNNKHNDIMKDSKTKDILKRIESLSKDMYEHFEEHGVNDDILEGYKILSDGIVESIDDPMVGQGLNKNVKGFNKWSRSIGQKFKPLNKNLKPIKDEMTDSAVNYIRYNTATPDEKLETFVDVIKGIPNKQKMSMKERRYEDERDDMLYAQGRKSGSGISANVEIKKGRMVKGSVEAKDWAIKMRAARSKK